MKDGEKAVSNQIHELMECKDWYCGHYHIDVDDENYHFMFDRILKAK